MGSGVSGVSHLRGVWAKLVCAEDENWRHSREPESGKPTAPLAGRCPSCLQLARQEPTVGWLQLPVWDFTEYCYSEIIRATNPFRKFVLIWKLQPLAPLSALAFDVYVHVYTYLGRYLGSLAVSCMLLWLRLILLYWLIWGKSQRQQRHLLK